MKFIVEGGPIAEDPRIDKSLVRVIVRASTLARRFQANPAATIQDIGAREGYGATYAGRLLRLTCLAPDIVVAILDGRQPPELTANALMAHTRLPLEWSRSERRSGFPRRPSFPESGAAAQPPHSTDRKLDCGLLGNGLAAVLLASAAPFSNSPNCACPLLEKCALGSRRGDCPIQHTAEMMLRDPAPRKTPPENSRSESD